MKLTAFYVSTVVLGLLAIIGVMHVGTGWEGPAAVGATAADPFAPLLSRLDSPLARLFLQIIVIIAAARLAGLVFRRMGLPAVVGEMTAGILLGPSLFGLVAPGLFAAIFPADSLGTLRLLSQVGICLFMFAVGMDLDLAHLRNRARAVVAVSHASIVVPYAFGVGLALFLFQDYAGPSASFTSFALFMGISMCITAFPVLVRILQERGLSRTPLGQMAIACAAVDDITAWSIMAFVVAIAGATGLGGAVVTLALAGLFVAAMLLVVRPLLPRLIGERALAAEEPQTGVLALVVLLVTTGSLMTELIGIHALFGAFLAGAVMPSVKGFRHRIGLRVESFSSVMLLPLFFAFTGLRTRMDLLGDTDGWLLCLVVVAVATAGKLGASAVAARLAGMELRQALQVGALMNTRGLMELIALNIGYDMGILSPMIFTVLVMMAVITTIMTGPLLTLFSRPARAPAAVRAR
ncbi:cation:proton antiporter [Roseococcus sp. YIM B11640]|uniref:cation:proton antiporter n=1 Tax=Roseococcus sp. YIM B11640 TaxID=3133973 RepID=UPI003C7DB28A